MRGRNDIKAIGSGAAGESLEKTCDEVAPSDTHPLSIVPRSQRRWLLDRFALIPEVNNSYEYRNSTKWGITATFVAIHGFVIIVAIFFLLPETLTRKSEPAITQELMRMSTRDSTKVKSKEFTTALKYYLIEPLSVLLLLRFPPVFLTVLIAAIAFSSVYVLNIVIESGFAQPRTNFKQTTIGLTYMSTGMGYIVSSMVGGQWMDSIIAREARKTGRYDGVQYMAPISLLFVFGFSSMLHFTLGTTMLTEFVRKRSSGSVAVNSFVRNILSCIGTIVAAPWMKGVSGYFAY
uniref:Major facilitator superfamily (MFS) profile domain-containing protein n=1 Tax=Fusarium oxysporum (strain Fo5176) TaxID=660025 RepID=A0A0D2Y6F8_FUSOF